MTILNPKVDAYLSDGCGRCSLYNTPQCKVHDWQKELKLLRKIVLDCGLVEELKYKQPCYTFHGSNLIIVSAFKESCVLSFFKGALLQDADRILTLPGENSQSTRWAKFTDVKQIIELEATLKAYIFEAIEVEKAGLKIIAKKTSEYAVPEELTNKFNENDALKAAFESLTPGRQRGYLLHFAAPKQAKTREARIEKYMQQILNGKGLMD